MEGPVIKNSRFEDIFVQQTRRKGSKIAPEMASRRPIYSSTSELNTLAMQTTISRSQANDDPNKTEKEIVDANKTWQSISKWGKNEGLDKEQQTAFEILAAKYVLTFYEEAVVDAAVVDATGLEMESYVKFIEKKANIYKLAQQNINDNKPFCMFITGPMVAGKCK